MKKRDEIEEEILDEDEILDDEEVLDDEEIDDEIDDEDFEEEKPAKKGKKAPAKDGKKKMGKGAKVGIIIGSVVAVLAIIAVVGVFVILPMFSGSGNSGAESYTATIGATAPTGVTAHTAINKNMKAGEMLLAAVDNYYEADFAANIMIVGGVNTTISGIKVPQGVQSFKVRYGKGNATDSSNKTENANYYAYSKSSGIATMYEEYYAKGETVKYRKASATKKYTQSVNTASGDALDVDFLVGTAYEDTISYNSIDAFIKATSTDFTKLWSYQVDKNTITNYNDKVTAEDGVYYFTVSLDLKKATADYLEVMKYQLSSNMNMTVESLEFTKLDLECAVYSNGFFKYIIVHESYKMNLSGVPVIGKLSGMEISNNCINEYSFNSKEKLPYYTFGDKKTMNTETFNFDDIIKEY